MTNMKYWVEMHQGLLEIFAELCIHRSPWINWAPENLLAPSIPHSPSLHDLPLHYLHYGAFFTSTQSIFVCPDPVLLLRLLLEPKSCHSLRYISAHTQEQKVAERGAAHTQLCSGMEPTYVSIQSDFLQHILAIGFNIYCSAICVIDFYIWGSLHKPNPTQQQTCVSVAESIKVPL